VHYVWCLVFPDENNVEDLFFALAAVVRRVVLSPTVKLDLKLRNML
jgi:hypothetical protein